MEMFHHGLLHYGARYAQYPLTFWMHIQAASEFFLQRKRQIWLEMANGCLPFVVTAPLFCFLEKLFYDRLGVWWVWICILLWCQYAAQCYIIWLCFGFYQHIICVYFYISALVWFCHLNSIFFWKRWELHPTMKPTYNLAFCNPPSRCEGRIAWGAADRGTLAVTGFW